MVGAGNVFMGKIKIKNINRNTKQKYFFYVSPLHTTTTTVNAPQRFELVNSNTIFVICFLGFRFIFFHIRMYIKTKSGFLVIVVCRYNIVLRNQNNNNNIVQNITTKPHLPHQQSHQSGGRHKLQLDTVRRHRMSRQAHVCSISLSGYFVLSILDWTCSVGLHETCFRR